MGDEAQWRKTVYTVERERARERETDISKERERERKKLVGTEREGARN